MNLHTILGANGTIGTELIPVLKSHGVKIRLVSRTPVQIEETESVPADMLIYDQVLKAVSGSKVVYLVVGITYSAKIWQELWPVIMRNVINACKETGAILLFFDNAYMYGRVKGVITEETPYNPSSLKGKVRADISRMLEQEMASGEIKALIARAVDFYGPRVTDKSAASILVFERMKDGKTAQWLINADVPRSYNYTPDAAEALYILATNEKSIGQVWHLPSANPITGRQFIKLASKYMNSSDKVTVIPKWVLKMISWFNPFMKEAYEMNYQDEFSFQFSSAKFEKAFNYSPTTYERAVKVTAEWFLNR